MADPLDFNLELQVLREGYDRKTEWFQPRIGVIPPTTAVLTMCKAHLWGSDIFTAVHEMRSDDLGRTWSDPRPHPTLDRRTLPNGVQECPCDMTPLWHRRTGKLLATGHTALYAPGNENAALLKDNANRRHAVWSVYDEPTRSWSSWEKLPVPDPERFWWFGAGCTQAIELPDGHVLLPLYAMDRQSVGGNFWKSCFRATVARCAFDGQKLTYLEHGDELTVPKPRGLCEPSLTRFANRFFLTLRNDEKAYVAAGDDGLHFEQPRPWLFDDGQELGSYNTQQHWVTHSHGLYLTYTRRGADNDHVIRHRAPLFIARVDPDRLVVLRHTERELVPNRGAQLGNFGVVNASAEETWVIASEGMQGDAKQMYNLALTEARGANNRLWLCRLRWNRSNLLTADHPDAAIGSSPR